MASTLTQQVGVLFQRNRTVTFTGPSAGVVEFDAVVNEVHSKTNEVTTHPIETGGNVSDHIRTTPDEIEINGVISDTPLRFFGTAAAQQITANVTALLSNSDPTTRSSEAYRRLRQIMDDGELVTVFTTLREYTDMAIVSLNVQRNARNGRSLNATMRLRQVISVAAQAQEVPIPEDPSKAIELELGKKNVSEATTEQSRKALNSNAAQSASLNETSGLKSGVDNALAALPG